MKIAIVTATGWETLTPSDRLLASALERKGQQVTPARWDDPEVKWAGFDLAVIRSVWNYFRKIDAFRTWLDAVERSRVQLWNPLDLVRWNLDKGYLRELAAAGVPIVPTEWVAQGALASLVEIMDRRHWERVVVKPTISGGAFETWPVRRAEAGGHERRFAQLSKTVPVMVQPFMEEVTTAGEWSLIFLGGRFSHAILKKVGAGDFRVQRDHGGSATRVEAPSQLRFDAEKVLAAVKHPWVYARVDGLEVDGRLVLMELEVIEPELFFDLAPEGADRLASVLVR